MRKDSLCRLQLPPQKGMGPNRTRPASRSGPRSQAPATAPRERRISNSAWRRPPQSSSKAPLHRAPPSMRRNRIDPISRYRARGARRDRQPGRFLPRPPWSRVSVRPDHPRGLGQMATRGSKAARRTFTSH